MDETQPQKNDKRFSIFLTILLALIIVIAVVLFAFSNGIFSDDIDGNVITYTTSFANISPEVAYNLINTTAPNELRVIDCRGMDHYCSCSFDTTKIDGRAEWNMNPKLFYQNISDPDNITDILVYSVNGIKGTIFCSELIGHVCGKIYNIAGGHDAWVAWKDSLEN